MKKQLLVSLIVTMIIGILVGVLLIVLGGALTPATIATIIKWGLIIYGVFIVIGNIPGLVSGIANANRPAGVFDLVGAVLGIALGIAMIFYHGSLLVAIVAAYLIIFPLLRILLAARKGEQLRRELVRIIMGVVLLVFVPNWNEAIANVLKILLFVIGGAVITLALLFGVLGIIRIVSAKEANTFDQGRLYVSYDEDVNKD